MLDKHLVLKEARRLVVKVGTHILTHETGRLHFSRIEQIVREMANLQNEGRQVILVSSGAIGAGLGKLGLRERPRTIPEKQAVAAVGQGILMHMYEKLFGEYGQVVAQVLLTKGDLSDRKRYLNARNALLTLLRYNVIPIINENDTVAVDEIKFGDNDTLSALVAGLVDADVLLLLTDTNGLYTEDPKKGTGGRLISLITEITPEIEKLAGETGSLLATGGMETKIQAGKIAMNSGVMMAIINGLGKGVLNEFLNGQGTGTLFIPQENRLHSKKRWIAFGSPVEGRVQIDRGASEALLYRGKSLLPSGIIEVHGFFSTGCVIAVINREGRELARGIVNYSSEEIKKIKGKQTAEIEKILGYKDFDEVIHRDNLTVCY